MKEGLGFGFDAGMLFTLPNKYLPTLGIIWRDVLGTTFTASRYINSLSAGTPDPIAQSINAAFSIRPNLAKGVKLTLSAEVKHLELPAFPLFKKLHFGLQIVTQKSFYFWLGLNQMQPTGGFGWRAKGGELEIGTYSQDIGPGDPIIPDRRFIVRYSINF
jgi:hypothetical protein